MDHSVLFIDKVFLKRLKTDSPLRGVELFNLLLLRDMMAAGVSVTVVADRSWRPAFEHILGTRRPELISPPALGIPFLHGIWAACRVVLRRFDTLLVGNAGDSLLPSIRIMRSCRVFRQAVVIAHRRPSVAFARLFRHIPGHILGVNQIIADDFSSAGCRNATVDYGILNADRFYPDPEAQSDDLVDFCVLGALDNAWKGADTAVQAFCQLPDATRRRARLHLSSYERPPTFDPSNIIAYSWMPLEEIPAFLRRMDVLVVPSHDEHVMRETFSQATVQGMLSGLPVIHSSLPILTEKFDVGGGLCFRDVDELTRHMERMINDDALRRDMGTQARQTAMDRYRWDTHRFLSRYFVFSAREPEPQPAIPPETDVLVSLSNQRSARIAPTHDTPEFRAWLEHFTSTHLPSGTTLASGRHRVVRLDYHNEPLAVKAFGRQTRWKDWIDSWRGSKAMRSFLAARHLEAHGVGTPAPVAVMERWSGRRLMESYFITRYEADLSAFREELIHLYRHEPHCDKIMSLMETVAKAVAALHRSGVMHGDLGNQNIMLRRCEPCAWSDVMFIDLNRVRFGTNGSWRRRAYDLSRITLPSDFLRVFKAMYLDGIWPPPKAFDRWERAYRAYYAWHTWTRAWRHPIRTWRRRHAEPDPSITYPDEEDLWIWDERSGQAISTLMRKDRKRLYPRGNAVRIGAAVAAAAGPVRRQYHRICNESFSSPVNLTSRIGMTLHPRRETWEQEWSWMQQLGRMPLLFRFYHHETESDWSFTSDCIRECVAAGYPASIAMVQDRRAVTDPTRWDDFVDRVMHQHAGVVEWVEIGHAINRVKWGVWTLDDYARLCRPFAPYAGADRGVRLMGPSVIDFEYQYLVGALRRLEDVIRFDALSHHLYVDRRGAPENPQSGLATAEKAALARAIAEWSPTTAARLIVSEVNWPLLGTGVYSPVGSPYEVPGPRQNDPSVDEAHYAAYMIRYLIQTLASGHVERVYWWRLAAHGYGLIDDKAPGGWRARLAFDALRQFMNILGDATYLRRLTTPDNIYAYAFQRADKEMCVLAYAHPQHSQWESNFSYASAQTISGDELIDRPAPLPCSAEPIYLRGVQGI